VNAVGKPSMIATTIRASIKSPTWPLVMFLVWRNTTRMIAITRAREMIPIFIPDFT
jgi:hypothetical protein